MVTIKILRGVYVDGQAYAPGAMVRTTALTAGEIVATKRAEYATPEDKAETIGAVKTAQRKMFPLQLKRSGGSWVNRKQFS